MAARYVAIIMDGNARWATERGLPVLAGHRQGAKALKQAVRNVRRDVMHDLRELKEAGETGSDDEHRAEVELQKLTDARIAEIDELLAGKEAEVTEV